MDFIWDDSKERINALKHGISFRDAITAFEDAQHVILKDNKHSQNEERRLLLGMVNGRVLTVRYTVRGGLIRIIGAGYWRKWAKRYEEINQT
jgi:uncharacterized protein